LQGLIAYLGIMAMLLVPVAVAWASHRDRQKERQKKRAFATKAAVAENGKLAEPLLTLNGEGPHSRAYSVIASCVAVVATDLNPVFVAGLAP
jgi:hypothetical protein